MKEQQEIIQKICGMLKHKKEFYVSVPFDKQGDICACERVVYMAEGKTKETFILGWLKSKEVLIGVYGKNQVCRACGSTDFFMDSCTCRGDEFCGHPDYPIECKGCNIDYDSTTDTIYAWKYHYTQLPHTIEECLEYYGRFLG